MSPCSCKFRMESAIILAVLLYSNMNKSTSNNGNRTQKPMWGTAPVRKSKQQKQQQKELKNIKIIKHEKYFSKEKNKSYR